MHAGIVAACLKSMKTNTAHTAAFGVYRSPQEAKTGVNALKRVGFRPSDISVVFPKNTNGQDLAYRQINLVKEGLVIGASLGLVILGLMTLMVTGSLSFSLMGALLGAIFGAACGVLVGIGTTEPISKRYAHYVKGGGVLVSIHSENLDEAGKAKSVLEQTGAQDVSTHNEQDVWKTLKAEEKKPDELIRRTEPEEEPGRQYPYGL
jgi:uncharacterized membrane protein